MENNPKKCSLENHSDKLANTYCKVCSIYMCKKCERNHSELFKNHNPILLDKNINILSDDISKENGHLMQANYFCNSHKIYCCDLCISKIKTEKNGKHADCEVITVEEIKKWCGSLKSQFIIRDEAKLVSQFRCNGSDAYMQFIDNLLQRSEETILVPLAELNYDFKVFDDPNLMRDALREKNAINNKSRMIAGYCYDWNVKHNRSEYDVIIGDSFKAKWNLEGDKTWAINPNSFEQVGCIHTAQGLEFDYVGVLIGKDLCYDKTSGRVITNKDAISKDDKTSGIRTANDDVARRLILNTYKTLLTRGQKGCYVFCEDESLREYFKSKASLC